jgi:hypothetical protein
MDTSLSTKKCPLCRRRGQIELRLFKDFKLRMLAVQKAFFVQNLNASLLNVLVHEIKRHRQKKKAQ